MAYKNYGTGVSNNPEAVAPSGGSFTAEDHSWDCLVFQSNKPLLDWEMNLKDEICGDYGLNQHVRRVLASGFLHGDMYESGVISGSFEFLPASVGNENKLVIYSSNFIVNGWNLKFEYSGTSTVGKNVIDLPDPPITGVKTDVVILEVWRSILKFDTTDNKSLTGLILRHGNVKAPDSVNLADDMMDSSYLKETQSRIQIQYRYRVVPAWDLETYPEVPDNVVANTVPYLGGSGVDGNASIFSYERVDGDPGLWRAGNGNLASNIELGTVDGYIYAIPLCAVFRRNSDQFNRSTNLNGGAEISSGVSDRPDGLFSDQVIESDVKDLRKGISSNFKEILYSNFQSLLQNNLATEHEITGDLCAGTSVFNNDNLGVGNRKPDAVRYYFSDRSMTETVVCHVSLVTAPFTQCDLDAASLPVIWYGNVDLVSLAPAGTSILEVRKVRIRISDTNEEVDGFDVTNGKIYVDNIDLTSTSVTIYLHDVSLHVGPIDLLVELAIGYPKNSGLDRTPISVSEVWMPSSLAPYIDASLVSPTLDINRLLIDSSLWHIDNAHRELFLWFKNSTMTEVLYSSSTSDTVMLPYRLDGSLISVNDGTNTYNTTNYTSNTSYTQINLDFGVPPNTLVSVTFSPITPSPPIPLAPDSTYEVFYYCRSTQSVTVPSGVHNIKLRVREASSDIIVITSGSASPDDLNWPLTGFCQVPMSNFGSDGDIDSSVEVQTPVSTTINSGVVNLQLKFSYLMNNEVILQNIGDTTVDLDGRNFWPRSSHDGVSFYGYPNLTSDVSHRVVYPILMEVVSTDTNMFRPGTLLMALMTSFSCGSQPVISLSTMTSDSCAALYRVRGNMINPRRLTA